MKTLILMPLSMLIVSSIPAAAESRITAVNEEGIPIHYILEGDKTEVTYGDNEKYMVKSEFIPVSDIFLSSFRRQ